MKLVYKDGYGEKSSPFCHDVIALYNKRDKDKDFLHIEINDYYEFRRMCKRRDYPRKTKSVLVCGPIRPNGVLETILCKYKEDLCE